MQKSDAEGTDSTFYLIEIVTKHEGSLQNLEFVCTYSPMRYLCLMTTPVWFFQALYGQQIQPDEEELGATAVLVS